MTAADLGQIPMSPDLGATLTRSSEFAGATGANEVTLEHLLAALCDDIDAIAVLDASHVNIEQLRNDVVGQVLQAGPAAHGPQGALGISSDVRRILEAAAAAARGSRRREINGAIVLAAIVGDARSMAAEILHAHGLTFDGAIRALQSALAPARTPAPQPPVADDVLARARERVQSRSAPSLRDLMKDMPQPVPPAPNAPIDNGIAAEHLPAAPHAEAASAPPPEPSLEPLPSTIPVAPPQAPSAAAHREAESEKRGVSVPDTPSGFVGPNAIPSQPDAQSSVSRARAVGVPESGPSGAPSPREPTIAPPMPQTPVAASPMERHPPASAPALPMHPAPSIEVGGYREPPDAARRVSAARPAQAGRDIPDFIRERKPGSAVPPPIPQMGSGPPMGPGRAGPPGRGAPPNALARAPSPAPAYPSSPPSLRIDNPAPQAPSGPADSGPPQPRQQRAAKQKKSGGDKRGKGAKVESGQLAENIPRSMRVGKTERVEVRIAKVSVENLTEGLEGDGAVWQHKVTITKAMAVRLRAPEGGFFIETASPETQWIENSLGYPSDDFASWRFLITPQERGWSRLQIIVSARTIGADGVAAETALPDQIVEVKVRRDLKRMFRRLFGWTLAAIVGGALSNFGEAGLTVAKTFVEKFIH